LVIIQEVTVRITSKNNEIKFNIYVRKKKTVMKHIIKLFEEFTNALNEGKKWKGNLITLDYDKKKRVITINAEGIEYLENEIANKNMYPDHLFSDILDTDRFIGNGLYYTHDIGYWGHLSNAPGIWIDAVPDHIYFYNNYMLTSFVEELIKRGKVVFNAHDVGEYFDPYDYMSR
jgi:hypothetical protein